MSATGQQDRIEPKEGFTADDTPQTFGAYVTAWLVRVRSGDLGALPMVIGLIIIVIIFGSLNETYLKAVNLVNLLLQLSGLTLISIGVVFVLLIAEIDLSVAFVSAVGGVTAALLLRPDDPGFSWPVAIGIALLVTTAIGFIQGQIITRAGVPSFVVTLAGLLAWSGVVLILTTQATTSGTIIIQNDFVVGLANNFLSDFWGWVLAVLIIGGYTGTELLKIRSRRKRRLPNKPISVVVTQIGALTVLIVGVVGYANSDRGLPMAILVVLVFLTFWTFIASRTRFGRHVYAVGGNPEAARRAGIDVARVRVAVFMISGFMAGVGGIVLASRLRSVATNTGGGNLLLNAIAAAVIGGTSLFGGSGRVASALLGALVITSVDNGMGLLGVNSGVKFVVTGLVLLAAVLVDSLSKRGRASSGVA
ncbi:MAG: ABC transporter permease [Actinomycetota bacterium]|nr:ABC transporter permease [Actinomycetota bacterium]